MALLGLKHLASLNKYTMCFTLESPFPYSICMVHSIRPDFCPPPETSTTQESKSIIFTCGSHFSRSGASNETVFSLDLMFHVTGCTQTNTVHTQEHYSPPHAHCTTKAILNLTLQQTRVHRVFSFEYVEGPWTEQNGIKYNYICIKPSEN